ncbi:hypothetical protein FM036_41495, partial [Nostoc sp. HG1]|nr:hypothetical protein [Nostoc sp. HG1]
QQRLQEKIQEAETRIAEYETQQISCRDAIHRVFSQITTIDNQITQSRANLSQMEQNLGAEKQKRDTTEQ